MRGSVLMTKVAMEKAHDKLASNGINVVNGCIRHSDLAKAVNVLSDQSSPTKIELDGFVLSGYLGGTDHTWKLTKSGELATSARVRFLPNSDFPALNDIISFPEYRGQGLGRKVLVELIKHYGKLRSDDQGRTSDRAAKMWESLGAKSLLNSARGYGRSHYAMVWKDSKPANAVAVVASAPDAIPDLDFSVIGKWSEGYSTSTRLSSADMQELRLIGNWAKGLNAFRTPKILYRGIRLSDTKEVSINTVKDLVKNPSSWSTTKVGAKYYIDGDKGVFIEWESPPKEDILVDFTRLRKLMINSFQDVWKSSTSPISEPDINEYVAEPKSFTVVDVIGPYDTKNPNYGRSWWYVKIK